MRTGHTNGGHPASQQAQHLRPFLNSKTVFRKVNVFGVMNRHGGRVNHQRIVWIFAERKRNLINGFLEMDGHTLGNQRVGEGRGGLVITRHLIAVYQKPTGQRTHANAANSQKINVTYRRKRYSCQNDGWEEFNKCKSMIYIQPKGLYFFI